MSCYTRHLGSLLTEAKIPDTKETRKRVDGFLREILGRGEAGCPQVWKEVKSRLASPGQRKELADELRRHWDS